MQALKGYHGPTDTGSSSSSRHTTSSSRVPATATPTPPLGSPLSLPPHARRNQLDEGEEGEQGVELIAASSSSAGAGQARGETPSPAPREPATPSGFYKPDQAVFDIDLVEEAMHLERCVRGFKGCAGGVHGWKNGDGVLDICKNSQSPIHPPTNPNQ